MATLAPGTLLGNGRYRVVKEVNRGGTAVVYECETLPSGEHVALKVMTVKDGRATMPIKGVKREIEYTASVQHENVVKLLDFFAEAEHVVIVWELIRGPDLLDLLNECGGRLSEADAAFYFGQLLRGVTFIHERGLCHRDLKPENVMIDRAARAVKIIDFGLSKHQASAVTLGVGTPDYMAPELLGNGSVQTLYERRTGRYDARASDIWALGVLLYLLVTGQYPFEDPLHPQNVVATLQNIMRGRMRPLPRRLSPACASLIHAMLTISPERRISLQDISRHPWLASGGPPAQATAAPLPAPAAPQVFAIKSAAQSSTSESAEGGFRLAAGFDRPGDKPNVTPRRVSFAFTASAGPVPQRHTPAMCPPPGSGRPLPSAMVQAPGVMAPPHRPSEAEAAQHAKRASAGPVAPKRTGMGGFCRLWFGSRAEDD
ncbi:CBL-interacting protein kinase 11 [Auxenochlorella protothecoides]|uniref:CBL-interacting protein kinase 11 n=1 Tax=Auxenochlorella protothecoides TaxID=3075 RepID=A0A087SAI6_AUXPR|nr:CBL-interacting protein kinase 11 [Auxenochlorella protothecoides]KFM22740.1 CBL-interacting protein kinase 11 [Auxenochlorella protothecoides]